MTIIMNDFFFPLKLLLQFVLLNLQPQQVKLEIETECSIAFSVFYTGIEIGNIE